MKVIRVLCILLVLATQAHAQADEAWSEQKITASDGRSNTYFGTAAAVSGSLAVIGAYGESNNRGAAYVETYVFENDSGSWTQVQKLVADDGAVFDNFGQAIAVDAGVLVIGANGATIGDQGAQGAAYVFVDDGSGWTQQQKLIADDGDTVDNFGVSAAIGGGTIFIGSPYAAVNGHANQGAVYVFTSDFGGWTQVDKLSASDGGANDSFGMSMSLEGTTLIVGATGTDGHGAAYVFDGSSGTWTQMQKLVADDAGSGDNFGDAIGLSGSDVLIAADVATVDGNTSRGAGYLFTLTGGSWLPRRARSGDSRAPPIRVARSMRLRYARAG